MAKYRVLQKSFINNSIVEEGAVVEYDGEAGPNLEPIDPPVDDDSKTAAKPSKA